MSQSNPYYRSAIQSDEQFAQDASEAAQNNHHSAYNSKRDINYKKPYFSQANYPSVPSYIPPPPPPPMRLVEPTNNIFSSMIDKYRNSKKLGDLASVSFCKNCNVMTESFVVKKNSFIVWIICLILLFLTYVCFFLPFLFDSLKNKHVICKNCGCTKLVVKIW